MRLVAAASVLALIVIFFTAWFVSAPRVNLEVRTFTERG